MISLRTRLLCLLLALCLMPMVAGAQAPLAPGQLLSFGSYPQGAAGEQAAIVWRVLSVADNQALLLSELILDSRPVQDNAASYNGWEGSELHKWVQADFLGAAFNEAEQVALLPQAQGELVGLPSADLLKQKDLGFGSKESVKAVGTAYAQTRGLKANSRGEASYWMGTRSETNKRSQRLIMASGSMGYTSADAKGHGIRPLIRLDLSKTQQLAPATGQGPIVLSVTQEILDAYLARQAEAEARQKAEAEEQARIEAEKQAQEAAQLQQAKQELALAQQALTAAAGGEESSLAPLKAAVEAAQLALDKLQSMQIEGFPRLTKAGFLPEGQAPFVYENDEEGQWRYASQTLRIDIRRYLDAEQKMRWFEAEIVTDPSVDRFRIYQNDPGNELKMRDMSEIAQANNLVYAMNGDYYIYRVRKQSKTTIGRIIRAGEVRYDDARKPNTTAFPNLDTLALFPDGQMQVYHGDEQTAAQLQAQGAEYTLSFGPYLIRDGQLSEGSAQFGKVNNPRAAIGMVAPGHYRTIVMEARTSKSKGSTIAWMAQRLLDAGCVQGYNLDGGQTAVMIFMGKQLNEIGPYDGRTNPRTQNEVLGIGQRQD